MKLIEAFEKSSDNLSAKIDVFKVAGVLIYLGYLLYYIGRRYIEGYYQTLGIPASLLQFSFQDYVYEGAHPFLFSAAIAFVLLLIGLIRFYQMKVIEEKIEQKGTSVWRRLWETLKNRRKRENCFTIAFFTYEYVISGGWLFYVCLLWLFGPPELTLATMTIILIVLIGGMGIIAMWLDELVVSFFRKNKFLTKVFFVITVLVLIVIPHLGGYSMGIFASTLHTSQDNLARNFKHIELVASQPANEHFSWNKAEDGLYHTTSTQYFILNNTESLFIIPSSNNCIVVVPKDSIVSFTIK